MRNTMCSHILLFLVTHTQCGLSWIENAISTIIVLFVITKKIFLLFVFLLLLLPFPVVNVHNVVFLSLSFSLKTVSTISVLFVIFLFVLLLFVIVIVLFLL